MSWTARYESGRPKILSCRDVGDALRTNSIVLSRSSLGESWRIWQLLTWTMRSRDEIWAQSKISKEYWDRQRVTWMTPRIGLKNNFKENCPKASILGDKSWKNLEIIHSFEHWKTFKTPWNTRMLIPKEFEGETSKHKMKAIRYGDTIQSKIENRAGVLSLCS